jgi:cell wall-associated NlpC family hydrolase
MKMKPLFFLLVISFFVTSCSTLKPASSAGSPSPADKPKQSSMEFINSASINPGANTGTASLSNRKKNNYYKQPLIVPGHISAIEDFSLLQFKYAIIEDAAVEEMQNEKLLGFMEEWYGAKYHFGGNGKDGIDCSAFVSTLMSAVYGINNLPRISKDQYAATPRIAKKQLQEGDLVFFHTYGKRKKAVTHVGVYLRNNKFIHASISGVMISDLSDGYYAAHYVGAGRLAETGMRDAAAN